MFCLNDTKLLITHLYACNCLKTEVANLQECTDQSRKLVKNAKVSQTTIITIALYFG